MTKEELESYADKYLTERFGAKTGNNYVRQALLDGYNLALRKGDISGSLSDLDGKTVIVKFKVSKLQPRITLDEV